MAEFRRDYAGPLTETSNRLFHGRAARTHGPGDALTYKWGSEYRDAAELEQLAKKLIGKPVTVTHPDDSPENGRGRIRDGAKGEIVGVVEDARVVGQYAEVDIRFHGDAGPRAIKLGYRDLSVGYDCDLDSDRFQRNSDVDHLAMVTRGRCRGPGGACDIRADHAACTCPAEGEDASRDAIRHESLAANLDQDDVVQDCACKSLAKTLDVGHLANHMPPASEEQQEKALMDEMNKKLAEAHAEAAAQRARADQAEKDRDAAKVEAHNAKAEAKTAQSAIDAEKARADQAEKDAQDKVAKAETEALAKIEKSRNDAADELDSKVASKVALVTEATPIIGTDDKGQKVDIFKMSDRAIKSAVVLRVDGDDLEKLDPKPSDDFVSGVYQGAIKRFERANKSRTDAVTQIVETRTAAVGVVAAANTGNSEQQAMDAERARLANQINALTQKDKE